MTPHPNARRGLTLVEMLVVMGLIGVLAGMLTYAIVTARRFSLRVACQENLRQIGQTLHSMALSSGGAYPRREDTQSIPWWANVYRNWEGAAPIDKDPNTGNLQLPEQLPAGMKTFKCPMGNPLDISGPDALRNSISYGFNFDVAYYDESKDPTHAVAPVPPHSACPVHCPIHKAVFCPSVGSCANQKARPAGVPYTSVRVLGVAPYDVYPPWTPCIHDKYDDPTYADDYFFSQIRTPATFILLSEANAGNKDVTGGGMPNWTGGRIASDAIARDNNDTPAGRCPIVPRHGEMANVLFADIHVELRQVILGESETINPNMALSNWTLTGE